MLQQHALSLSTPTDDRRELPFRHDEINTLQNRLASEPLRHSHKLQHDYNNNEVKK
jgi:hypothetical protein